MSRASEWQKQKRAQGLCTICGKRKLHPLSISRCWVCGTKARVRMRAKLGLDPGTFKITRFPRPTRPSDLERAA